MTRILGLVRQRFRKTSTGRDYIDQFAKRASATVQEGGRVLDAGAGDSPYCRYFQHCHYEAADLCKRPERAYDYVDFSCDLTSIPVEDGRYDMVLCTQVIEHVVDPLKVLLELTRCGVRSTLDSWLEQ